MKRVRHIEPLAHDALGLRGGFEGGDCRRRAGNDDGLRAIHGGDDDAVAGNRRKNRRNGIGRGGDEHHGAGLNECAHQRSARGDKLQRILGTDDAVEHRSHVLADAMPDHELGLDAPTLQQARQTELDGEDRGLRIASVVDQCRRRFGRI